MYECTDSVMSILPLAEVLGFNSCDNWGGTVGGIMEDKRSDSWYPAVVESIRRDGFTKGISINSSGWVCDGHHRIAAAVELGLAFIPVETKGWAEYDGEFFNKVKSGEYGPGMEGR